MLIRATNEGIRDYRILGGPLMLFPWVGGFALVLAGATAIILMGLRGTRSHKLANLQTTL